MILVDVNILVYAFDRSAPAHDRALDWVETARRRRELALCDLVTSGFVRLVTNPKVFERRAANVSIATEFIDALGARHLHGGRSALDEVRRLASSDVALRADLVPDAWIAATALVNGAAVATADAGFKRFPRLVVVDPVS